MNKQKGFTSIEVLFVLVFFPAVIGWGMNLYKLANCDFEPSYKAEVIRTVGVFIPPVGAVVGYFPIED